MHVEQKLELSIIIIVVYIISKILFENITWIY